MSSASREGLTAVIVTWNSAGEVPGLIESVNRHLSGRLELLFVDNASSDATVEVIGSLAPDSRLIALGRNVGFGPANNIGVRAVATDTVALLNPDTELVDGSLVALGEIARRERALLGPRLLNEDGSRQISAFPPPGSWELALISAWPGALMPRRLRQRCEPWRFDHRLIAGWLSAACLVGRRDVLVELGPFDDRLALYGEDTDLCLRAWKAGVQCVFAPDIASVVHLGSRSGSQAFADVGTGRKIDARRWIVRNRLGPARAAADMSAQWVLHGSRWVAKRLLRRDASIESVWLRSAVRSVRDRRALAPLP